MCATLQQSPAISQSYDSTNKDDTDSISTQCFVKDINLNVSVFLSKISRRPSSLTITISVKAQSSGLSMTIIDNNITMKPSEEIIGIAHFQRLKHLCVLEIPCQSEGQLPRPPVEIRSVSLICRHRTRRHHHHLQSRHHHPTAKGDKTLSRN